MGEYWTIDGMLEATGKKKKDKKGKDKDKKQKDNKDSKPEKKSETKMSYSELLKTGAEGLYVANTQIDNSDVECCIIKSKEFQYPKVAISEDGLSYKDWLAERIKSKESNMNVNKAMYNSTVRQVNVPKRFVHQLVELIEDVE